jgi:hypothetical protein
MARATSDPEGQGSVKLIEAENKARKIAPAFCESYTVRTNTLPNCLPLPEEPPKINTARFIDAEKETRTVARGPAFETPRMNLYFQPLVDEGGGVKLLDTANRSLFLGREQEFITSPPITNVLCHLSTAMLAGL